VSHSHFSSLGQIIPMQIWDKVLPSMAASEVIEVPSKKETPCFSSDNGNDKEEYGQLDEGHFHSP
jgi:hypothetical protein